MTTPPILSAAASILRLLLQGAGFILAEPLNASAIPELAELIAEHVWSLQDDGQDFSIYGGWGGVGSAITNGRRGWLVCGWRRVDGWGEASSA